MHRLEEEEQKQEQEIRGEMQDLQKQRNELEEKVEVDRGINKMKKKMTLLLHLNTKLWADHFS